MNYNSVKDIFKLNIFMFENCLGFESKHVHTVEENKLNKNGFRCDNFDTLADKRIIFLGCSHTEGIGLDYDEVWAYQLHKLIVNETKLNIPYWNLGVGGGGLDTIVRVLYHYVDQLKPDIIFGYYPNYRVEIYKDGIDEPYSTNLNDKILYSNRELSDPKYILYNTTKNLAFLELLSQKYSSLYLWNHWSKNISNESRSTFGYNRKYKSTFDTCMVLDNKAQDNLHSGANSHKLFAEKLFAEKYDEIMKKLNL